MKRTLSLLMCLIMLLTSVTFLFSCKKDEEGNGDQSGGEVNGIDLTGYSIITGVELTEMGNQYALDFARNISKLTTVDISVVEDTASDVVKTKDLEILIGVTSREESVKTYNEIEENGWAVRVFEHKIAIVGTSPYLTTVALNWFERTYLNAEHISGTVLSVQEKYVVSKMPMLTLTEKVNDADTTFTVVYETGKDSNDVPQQVGSKVCESLFEKTGLTAQFVTADTEAGAKEILVGNMSRIDVKEEMAKIDADEYAVTIKDNKIYLVAWSDNVLPFAYELFEEMLFASSVSDENGNITAYNIPSNCTLTQKYASEWITDFPKPVAEGLYPEAAVDANDGALQYIYAGSGATRETFVAYCETLKAAGFTPMGNEDVQWESSSFRTFVNYEKGVSLHVSHMAFSHAAEEQVEGMVNSIRIVSGSTEWGGKLVDSSYFRPQIAGTDEQVKNGTADYVKRMNSQITTALIDYSVTDNRGLGQLITLADGSFIVLDGGNAYSDEEENLWDLMREMHKKAHGSYPTKENPVHIRAWIISHEHNDHHTLVRNFCDSYGFKPELKFDYLMYNPGSMTQLRYPSSSPTANLRNNMKAFQEKVKNGFEYIQVSTGQVFYFANCRLEILYTIDDMYPWRCNTHNNSSLIFRTALFESDGTNSHESTTLWLGDAQAQAGQVAGAMYGSFLNSEQLQVSHHGSNANCDERLYELVGNCKVLWFPQKVNQTYVNRCINYVYSPAFMNPECQLLIFAGSDYTYDTWNVTLIISPTGPLLDQLYDPTSGAQIEPQTELAQVMDVPAYKAANGLTSN